MANDQTIETERDNIHGVAAVLERNHWYRDRYIVQIRISAGLLILSILLTAMLCWLVTHPPQPKFFATTTSGELIPLTPLNEPNTTNDALLNWVARIVRQAYTYDAVNYREQLAKLEPFFTEKGYESFLIALNASGNLTAVTEKRLITSAIVSGGVITAKGVTSGVYTWKVELQLTVTYTSSEENITQPLTVLVLILRTSTLQNLKGLAIHQILSKPGVG